MMSMQARRVLFRAVQWLAFSWVTVATSAHACPLSTPDIEQRGISLNWTVISAPLVMGEHFALDILVCPADAELTRADATMPAHRHGMNYRPSIIRQAPGHWRAEGYLFHMSGDWELLFDLRIGERSERLKTKVQVP